VADTAQKLAEDLGWEKQDTREIWVAGMVHDLGKLAIPKKILDKPGPLDSDEVEMIRTHTYHTYHLLPRCLFSLRHW